MASRLFLFSWLFSSFFKISFYRWHINTIALKQWSFSSFDWYFQVNLCKGLTVVLLYEGIKLSHWWFLCLCIPGKNSCFRRETHSLKMILMIEIFQTLWMNLVLDSIPFSTLAHFLFCYFIFPEKENIKFHPCFSSHLSVLNSTLYLHCLYDCLCILSLSLNYFQRYFLFNNNRRDSSCPVETSVSRDWDLPVSVNRTRNWRYALSSI